MALWNRSQAGALRSNPAGLKRLAGALVSLCAMVSMVAADWTQWRGPRRDGVCDEKGLLQHWPEEGPKLLWKNSGLGRGYSAPIFAGGRIYLTGDADGELHIVALNLEGERVWQTKNGRSWTGPYPGARASCAYSEGKLYHMNAHGRVACFDAKDGRELWSVNLVDRFGGKVIHWGFSECVLVDGARVIVTAGGTQALMAALDKHTGDTVWSSEPLLLGKNDGGAHERIDGPETEADNASYASPILMKIGERRQLVNCSLRHVFGVDADNGKLLWTRPLPTRYNVIAATPVLVGRDAVFVTAPDGQGGSLYRIHNSGAEVRVETVWKTELDTCQGGLVYADGTLFGSRYRARKEWAGLDARTGEVRHTLKDFAKGSVLYADGRLYCLSEEGEVALLKPVPDAFNVVGRFRLVPERKSDAWTHPVIADGRLYLRYQETLYCYDVRAK
jgi:outer membrane protein assembly factor BamB